MSLKKLISSPQHVARSFDVSNALGPWAISEAAGGPSPVPGGGGAICLGILPVRDAGLFCRSEVTNGHFTLCCS